MCLGCAVPHLIYIGILQRLIKVARKVDKCGQKGCVLVVLRMLQWGVSSLIGREALRPITVSN